jgi:20S proteasome subunit beta 3
MAGKNCVGIASDSRLGNQAQTVACDFQKIYKMTDRVMVGLTGLATDVQTLQQLLTFKINMYKLKEEREMKPETFSALLSSTLYEKRFGPYFTEPVVAGLTAEGKPFLSAFDLIGAGVHTDDFVVAGTSTENLYGMCETLYRPNMNEEELFETLAQALLASVDRDALSGWGGVVHIISMEGITTKKLKCRQD